MSACVLSLWRERRPGLGCCSPPNGTGRLPRIGRALRSRDDLAPSRQSLVVGGSTDKKNFVAHVLCQLQSDNIIQQSDAAIHCIFGIQGGLNS